MSTTNPPAGPDPSARRRAARYLHAATFAVVLGGLFLAFTEDRGLALKIAAGLLVVLVVHQLAQDVTRHFFARRSEPAGIVMAGPIAGTVASYGAICLYAYADHLPLLAIALIGFCVTANAMLHVTTSNDLWAGFAGVGLGGAFAALGSPWGIAVLVFLVYHLIVEWRLAIVDRRTAQASRSGDTPAPLYGSVVVWLVISLGVVLCGIAFDFAA